MMDDRLFDLAHALLDLGFADPVAYLFTMLRVAVVFGGCFSFVVLLLMTAVQLATLIGERRAALGHSLITRVRMPSLHGISTSARRGGRGGPAS